LQANATAALRRLRRLRPDPAGGLA